MKKKLYSRFMWGYICIGILCFFLITLGGSYMIERYLEHNISDSLYQEANRLASEEAVLDVFSSENPDELQHILSVISEYQDSIIWIMNNRGEILLSTRQDISLENPILLQDFDPTMWGSTYYQVGDFYGYFPENRLSVIAPVTTDMTTKGYVAVHYLMSNLYRDRGGILIILQIMFVLVYSLSFLLILYHRRFIQKPLEQITKGAAEYANGNLSYRIPVTSSDEIGYLANTLNYMSDQLNKNGEYQRQFISNVSHDFRSPLTSIKGYVEAMLDGTIPPEMQERYLKIISYEAGRLEKLTRSLLTLNELDIKKRMMHIRRFDINDTIKTTAATFEGICTERKIRLELILSGKELYAKADMEQIQQVLYNLLDNAIKFSPDTSSIILETTEKNGKIFVSVKDHGSGIPRESIRKIWERFYKNDTSRGKDRTGTGLGLSIVKEIIKAHEQHIDVISTEGVGTEFIFTLEKAR